LREGKGRYVQNRWCLPTMGETCEAFSAKTTIRKGFFKVTYSFKATEEKK
jgi:hypothetical protein